VISEVGTKNTSPRLVNIPPQVEKAFHFISSCSDDELFKLGFPILEELGIQDPFTWIGNGKLYCKLLKEELLTESAFQEKYIPLLCELVKSTPYADLPEVMGTIACRLGVVSVFTRVSEYRNQY